MSLLWSFLQTFAGPHQLFEKNLAGPSCQTGHLFPPTMARPMMVSCYRLYTKRFQGTVPFLALFFATMLSLLKSLLSILTSFAVNATCFWSPRTCPLFPSTMKSIKHSDERNSARWSSRDAFRLTDLQRVATTDHPSQGRYRHFPRQRTAAVQYKRLQRRCGHCKDHVGSSWHGQINGRCTR